MKTHKSISLAILTALSLYSPWTGVQNCNAQTDTNLYRARINLVSITKNANGNLVQDEATTAEFVREFAEKKGITDVSGLALAYNRSDTSLQIVDRNTREVIATPLNFDGGISLANSNNTRIDRLTHVSYDGGAPSGLLSAIERMTYARTNGQLRSFGMLARISFSFNEGTSNATICRGTLAVGSSITPENLSNNNIGNEGNNQGNLTVDQTLGLTNVNQGGFGNGGN